MKIKKIEALIKKRKWLTILEDNNEMQWIGNGGALYAMEGMPKFSPDTFLTMLSVGVGEKDLWIIQDDAMPEAINIRPTEENEPVLMLGSYGLQLDGETLLPMFTGEETLWLNERYIEPIKDVQELRFHIRECGPNDKRVVALDGMFPIAVIKPIEMQRETLDKFTAWFKCTRTVWKS